MLRIMCRRRPAGPGQQRWYRHRCPLELIAVDLLRQQLDVNVIGQLAVMQALLPAVRRAGGTITVVGSLGDRWALPFAGPLTASTSALATLAGSLRQDLAPSAVRVILVEPGEPSSPIRSPAPM